MMLLGQERPHTCNTEPREAMGGSPVSRSGPQEGVGGDVRACTEMRERLTKTVSRQEKKQTIRNLKEA